MGIWDGAVGISDGVMCIGYYGWYIWFLDGVFCIMDGIFGILDGVFGILDGVFGIWDEVFHIWVGVFGIVVGVFGIWDCGWCIWYLVLWMVYLVSIWDDVENEMPRDQSPGRGFCRLTKTTFPNLSLERSTDYIIGKQKYRMNNDTDSAQGDLRQWLWLI